MRVKLLVFSVLLGLVVAAPPAGPTPGPTAPTTATTTTTAPGPLPKTCPAGTKGWKLACQVYEYEEKKNDKPKHTYSKFTEDYFKKECPPADRCPNSCDLTLQEIKDALLDPNYDQPIRCDLTELTCTSSRKKCIAEIEVDVLESEQAAPDVTTTTAASTTGSGGTKKKRESPEGTTRVRREAKIVKRKTFIFPVRTLSMDKTIFDKLGTIHTACTAKPSQTDPTPKRDDVLCLITETASATASGGESLDVWKYTGLPYDLVTDSRVTNLLPGRAKTQPAALCAQYGSTDNCRPMPICDGVLDAAKCEMPCGLEHMAIKEKPKDCRILDVQGYPFERQNFGPYATWMTEAQNLDNKIFKINETESPTPTPPDAKKPPPLPAYPRPVNLSSVSEGAYQKKIAANYWLYDKTNPFFSKHPGVGYVQVPKCSSNDHLKAFLGKVYSDHPENRPEFCDSDSLVTSSNLMLYAIIGVAVVGVLIFCVVVLVVVFICWRKKKAAANQESGEQKDDGTTSKSGAVDGGTSQAGAV